MARLPRFNPTHDGKLAYAVYTSERLTGLLPANEIEPLVAAFNRAVALAAAAAKVAVATRDTAAGFCEAVRTCEPDDVGVLIEQMARAIADAAAHREAADLFAALPADARREILSCIEASEDDLYEGLASQLTDVLDRAKPVVTALRGIPDAEAAIEAKRTDQWTALRDLSREYDEIVSAFRALRAAADDDTAMVRPAFADVLFGGLAAVTTTDVPFDATATASPEHLRYVVENRERLLPRIVRATEATSVLPIVAVPTRRVRGQVVTTSASRG
ncbi:hypothetical protein DQ244_17215 [Blastococcus sp. TBT05-19]|uniref:hypothetical protein n=1 Tax=Blastococcus sp. TBT05-19 TaxID=2250581 RepID=UPI000DEB0724|nr:hypothetical protein [Blastococcus sp. TBT05-19]RBY87079.1 hypothetical protein DQ244_17215 [Blastococcus sp. TBT05-19]